MNAAIQLKDKSGKPVHFKHCVFTDEQWNALKNDWLGYLTTGSPKGGAYRCVSGEMYTDKEEIEVLLKFDDVAAIG